MPMPIHRRDFIQAGAISSAALATYPLDGILTQHLDEQERAAGSESFWQNGAHGDLGLYTDGSRRSTTERRGKSNAED